MALRERTVPKIRNPNSLLPGSGMALRASHFSALGANVRRTGIAALHAAIASGRPVVALYAFVDEDSQKERRPLEAASRWGLPWVFAVPARGLDTTRRQAPCGILPLLLQ